MELSKKYGKVAVVMGGKTTEREVSLMSGNAILKSLFKSGVDAFSFDPSLEPLANLVNYGCERAILIIHGKNGEDGDNGINTNSVTESNREYVVAASKMTPQIQYINRTGGKILSITEI